jgi:hypothetical protein
MEKKIPATGIINAITTAFSLPKKSTEIRVAKILTDGVKVEGFDSLQ